MTTYAIFSLESGNMLEDFKTKEEALEVAAKILASEPEAADAFAVITFDHRGYAIDVLEGTSLLGG